MLQDIRLEGGVLHDRRINAYLQEVLVVEIDKRYCLAVGKILGAIVRILKRFLISLKRLDSSPLAPRCCEEISSGLGAPLIEPTRVITCHIGVASMPATALLAMRR
jgi:hypothetical protein